MIGESIGNYVVVSELGRGGMGVVYLAEHQHLRRRAAVKLLRPELSTNQETVQRFFTEARATARIPHPAIVEILDCGIHTTGSAYIVMEYLEGEALRSALARAGKVPVGEAISISRQIAAALHAAHTSGIVHRDLKPDNVFLVAQPAGAVKILDFGVAKLLGAGDPDAHHHTQTGAIIGTPVYMSPEQCDGGRKVDHRSDIYSLGCMMFEMLCGRPPFESTATGQLIVAHLTQAPPDPRLLEPDLPPALADLLLKMLAKAPADRPQAMTDVLAALEPATKSSLHKTAVLGLTAGVLARDVSTSQASSGAQNTTLRAATGQTETSPGDERDPVVTGRRRPWALVGAGGAAVLGLAAFLLFRGGEDQAVTLAPAQTSPAVVQSALVPATPPVPPAPEPKPDPASEARDSTASSAPPVPSEPSIVEERAAESSPRPRSARVRVASIPPGAEICAASSGKRLGTTDGEIVLPRSGRPLEVVVHHTGYRPARLKLDGKTGAPAPVRLVKVGTDELEPPNPCR